MSYRHVVALLALVLFAASPAVAGENSAKEAADLFAKGDLFLKQGDLNGAYEAYVSAAKADPKIAAYAEKAKLVRRVQFLREYVDSNEVSLKWEKMVVSLHAFYLQNGIHQEALTLNRMAHKKLNKPLTASLLAETLLEMDKNAEALEVFKGMDRAKLDLQNHLYLGIAYARLGKTEKARRVQEQLAFPKEADLGLCYDYARLNTLLGHQGEACRLLTRCFEMTPPSQLDTVKGFAKQCRDFKPLFALADFKAVMKTASKISESGCSGGSSCATCPSKSGCSTEGEKADGCSDCEEGKSGEKKDCGGCSGGGCGGGQ